MTVVPGSAVRRRYIFSSVSSSMVTGGFVKEDPFRFSEEHADKSQFLLFPQGEDCGSSPPRYPSFPLNGKDAFYKERGSISLSAVSSGYDAASAEVPIGM